MTMNPCACAEVNEGSTAYLRLTLRDKDGIVSQPSALRYRIDNAGDRSSVLAWTSATATLGVADITIAASLNNTENGQRIKRVTVEASYGDERLTQEWDYEVKALEFIPS